MKNILLVEDDITLNQGLCMALNEKQAQVETCFSLSEARSLMQSKEIEYDLVILDVNLPDGNGLDFLKEWKKQKQAPVILLTANDMEMDIVNGLESGADDYITKPFSLAVLRARVNTQLQKQEALKQEVRKYKDTRTQMDFQNKRFRFDFVHMEFWKDEALVELSKTEQKLLHYLVENQGQTITREMLLAHLWPDGTQYVEENALSVSIKRLRDKLEDVPSKPEYIKTVYGIGYTWIQEKEPESI